MKKNLFLVLAYLLLTIGVSTSVEAQSYMKGAGINGPAEVNGSSGWIIIQTVTSLNFEEIKVTFTDKATPYLKDATNGDYEIVKFRKGGNGYLKITIENVTIKQNPNKNSLSLNYTTIEAVSHEAGGGSRTLTRKELKNILK